MDVIDGKWIKARIGDKRGARAAFGRATGFTSPQVSRIINGERKVKADEIPRIVAYFRAQGLLEVPQPGDATLQLRQETDNITEAEARFLLVMLEALRAAGLGEGA